MKVLVTGATGEVGRPLVQRLVAEGCSVRALCRRPDAALPAGVEAAAGDVTEPVSLAGATLGMDAVVHAAAHLGGGGRAVHARVNAAGTRAVLEAALRAGVERVVHVSTIAVHARRDGTEMVPATAACDPHAALRDDYAWSKIAAERWAACVAAETGLPIAILRPGIVWGGTRRFVARVSRPGPRGTLLVVGSPAMRLPMVHVDDVVEAVWRTLAAPAVPATPLHVVCPEMPTQAAWLAATAAGRRPVFLPAARVLRRLAGERAPARLRAVAYRLAWATQSASYDHESTAAALGWRPGIGLDATACAPASGAVAFPSLALADEGS